MQLRVGSQWTDTQGNIFVVDAVTTNGDEIWVSYRCKSNNTYYNCLAEAFTYRFKEQVQ